MSAIVLITEDMHVLSVMEQAFQRLELDAAVAGTLEEAQRLVPGSGAVLVDFGLRFAAGLMRDLAQNLPGILRFAITADWVSMSNARDAGCHAVFTLPDCSEQACKLLRPLRPTIVGRMRNSARISTQMQVKLMVAGREHSAELIDLSEHGFAVRPTGVPLEKNCTIQLMVPIDRFRRVNALAHVVSHGPGAIVGLRFIHLSPTDRECLMNWIAEKSTEQPKRREIWFPQIPATACS